VLFSISAVDEQHTEDTEDETTSRRTESKQSKTAVSVGRGARISRFGSRGSPLQRESIPGGTAIK
jgi:hypothetical protein